MIILVAGLIVFLGVHLLPAVQGWRVALVRRWGERRYKGIFSLVSFAGLGLIIAGYPSAPRGPLLFAPAWEAIAIAPYAMALSFALFAAANLRGHIRRLVKHPMLLGLGIWAGIHLLANRRGACAHGLAPAAVRALGGGLGFVSRQAAATQRFEAALRQHDKLV